MLGTRCPEIMEDRFQSGWRRTPKLQWSWKCSLPWGHPQRVTIYSLNEYAMIMFWLWHAAKLYNTRARRSTLTNDIVILQGDSFRAKAAFTWGPGQSGYGGPQRRGLHQTQNGLQSLWRRGTKTRNVRFRRFSFIVSFTPPHYYLLLVDHNTHLERGLKHCLPNKRILLFTRFMWSEKNAGGNCRK